MELNLTFTIYEKVVLWGAFSYGTYSVTLRRAEGAWKGDLSFAHIPYTFCCLIIS